MEISESVIIVVVLLGLGIGLIATIIGFFLFNGSNWWDKF